MIGSFMDQCHSGKSLSYDDVMEILPSSSLCTGYHIYVNKFHKSTVLFQGLHRNRFTESRIRFSKTKMLFLKEPPGVILDSSEFFFNLKFI